MVLQYAVAGINGCQRIAHRLPMHILVEQLLIVQEVPFGGLPENTLQSLLFVVLAADNVCTHLLLPVVQVGIVQTWAVIRLPYTQRGEYGGYDYENVSPCLGAGFLNGNTFAQFSDVLVLSFAAGTGYRLVASQVQQVD